MRFVEVIFLALFFLLFSQTGLSQTVEIDASAFGGIRARRIGPAVMSGRITDIEGVHRDPRILVVGSAGGGVWKSMDGGITFSPIFEKHTMSIGDIAIDQKNPETIWVGTGECNVRNSVSVGTGLYRTVDGGKNWQLMGFADSERISTVVIDPKNNNTIYVGVMGHLWNSHKERGVYKSTDNGKTWKQVLFVDENSGCADLEIDPQEPDVLYASIWEFRRSPDFFTSGGKGSGLYKSTDAGQNWKKIQRGLPDGDLGRIALAVAPSRPGRIYATVEARKGSGLYRSDEMGENWKMVNSTMSVTTRPFYFSHLVVDPTDYRCLYVTGLFLSSSQNGGESFDFNVFGNIHSDMHAVWINPQDPDQVFVGTDGGVYISSNRAQNFRLVGTLPVSQFYHVDYDMERPYNVYGGLQDNGSWVGPSRSIGNPGISNVDWRNVGSGDGFYVRPHPSDNQIVYYTWQGGRLVRHNRKSFESKDIKPLPTAEGEPEYRYNWNAAFFISPNDPEIIYMGAQFLFRSSNRGDTWTKISPDLTSNDPEKQRQSQSGGVTTDNTSAENHCTIFTICESPLNRQVIWVGTDDGNLQVSKDGGKSWTNTVSQIPGLPESTWCSTIEAGHHNEGTAFATFDGHRTGDMSAYVYMTTDFGANWTALTSDSIEGYCHVIREDLKNPDLLFLGSEFGLYLSINRGQQWFFLKEAMPKVSVRDMIIHPREDDLILATHGLGILIVDDITPLRALTADVLSRVVALLPSRPSRLETSSIFMGFAGNAEFVGENPGSGAVISYYLKKRHIFGELKLEVLDDEGKIIADLPTSKRKGINRVFWSMRLKAPKTASTSGLSAGFVQGPMVKEGSYQIRLTKGSEIETGKLHLIPNPLSNHSKDDRTSRQETVLKIYRLQESLGYIADSTKNLINHADLLIKRLKGKKDRSRIEKYREKLSSFHNRIVSSQGVFGGEQLREKVMGLYNSVMQFGGRPSDSQIYYLRVLDTELKQAETVFSRLVSDRLALNAWLKKKKLPEFTQKSREEYLKK